MTVGTGGSRQLSSVTSWQAGVGAGGAEMWPPITCPQIRGQLTDHAGTAATTAELGHRKLRSAKELHVLPAPALPGQLCASWQQLLLLRHIHLTLPSQKRSHANAPGAGVALTSTASVGFAQWQLELRSFLSLS